MSTVNETAEPASKVELNQSGDGAGAVESFDIILKVRRYVPETSEESYWDEWKLTMYGTDRVLDALHKVKWEHDGSLTFRRSCAHGICGSDAMRINGRNRLACKTLLKDLDLSKPITVEAIKGLPVEKDLIVDMEPFFQSYREIMPFLVTSGHEPTREATSPRRTGRSTTTPRSASSAPRAPRPARCSGPTASTSVRPRSSTRTASSSIRVTKAETCASRSSTTRKACGAAAPPSTARRRARAASR